MHKWTLCLMAMSMIFGCAKEEPATEQSAAPDTSTPESADAGIHMAAGAGNLEAVKLHLAQGTDINIKEPAGGSTPLMVAALTGQTEVAKYLIDQGADLAAKSNDEATALHIAAFFAHPETVTLLLEKGADMDAQNSRGETALDNVAMEWGPGLEAVYKYVGEALQLDLDLERIKDARPKVAALLRAQTGSAVNQ